MMKIHPITSIGIFLAGVVLCFQNFPAVQAEVGPTVSLGAHPYASFTGDITSSAVEIVSVPSDKSFLITDVIITQTESTNGICGGLILFETDNSVVGRFRIATSVDGNEGWGQGLIAHSFQSGLPVEAGQTLTIRSQSFSCSNISYTISGRYIHP